MSLKRRAPMKRTAFPSISARVQHETGKAPIAKVGKRGKRNAALDRKWSASVRDNAQGRCEICGLPGAHGHHLFTKAAHPELRHVTANGVLLCALCHDNAHADMTGTRVWIAARRADFAAIYDPKTDRPKRVLHRGGEA